MPRKSTAQASAAAAGSRAVRQATTVSRRTNSGSEIKSYGKRSKEKDEEHKSPAASSGKEGKDGSPEEKRAHVLAAPEPSRKECDKEGLEETGSGTSPAAGAAEGGSGTDPRASGSESEKENAGSEHASATKTSEERTESEKRIDRERKRRKHSLTGTLVPNERSKNLPNSAIGSITQEIEPSRDHACIANAGCSRLPVRANFLLTHQDQRARRSAPTRSPMDAEICEFIRSPAGRPAGTVHANLELKIGS